MGRVRQGARSGAQTLAGSERMRPRGPADTTVLALQRSVGNRAVARLLAARRPVAGPPSLARKKLTISTQFLAAAGGASASLNPVAAALKLYT